MKKWIVVLVAALPLYALTQNVGIGTQNPVEKLDVAGAIRIGNTGNAAPQQGTIRWNADRQDFEGYNGSDWVSLTGGKSAWGSQDDFSIQSGSLPLSGTAGINTGNALALSNNFLAVGVFNENDPVYDYSGAVRLYVKSGNEWIYKSGFRGANANAHGNFGWAVAMSGNAMVVGAPGYANGSNTEQGKAFFYAFNQDGTVAETATLTAGDGSAGDGFGKSVGINNNRLIIGASGNDITVPNQGCAYIFEKLGASWLQTARLVAANPHDGDYLGSSVAIHGNFAAIGSAIADVNGLSWSGKVNLFLYNGTNWVETATLTNPLSPAAYSAFGQCLQMTSDTLLIGMPQCRNGVSSGNGKVLLYRRNGNTWTFTSAISAPDGKLNDGFGSSVHLNGDNLIVGAEQANVLGTPNKGKAYIFRKNGTDWICQSITTSSDNGSADKFGASVAITPNQAIVGAPLADYDQRMDVGRVYFFNRQ